jgi:two-component system chemotaxis sensor kinase CheA
MSAHDPEILGMFLAEARERLESFQQGMLELEEHPEDKSILDRLFRDMHTVKGGARYLECAPVSELCHAAEDFLDDLRNGKGRLGHAAASVLLGTVDRLVDLFAILERQEAIPQDFTADLIRQLSEANRQSETPEQVAAEDPVAIGLILSIREQSEVIRAALDGLVDEVASEGAQQKLADALELLRNACEYAGNHEAQSLVQSIRLACASVTPGAATAVEKARILSELDRLSRAVKPGDNAAASPPSQTNAEDPNASAQAGPGDGSRNRSDSRYISGTTLRVEQVKIDRGIALAGELSIMRSGLRHAARQIARDPGNLAPIFEAADVLDRIANEIEEHALGLRRVAMRHCFGRFPRVVRDLGLALDKEIALDVEGDGIEVDKTVVEALGEPLVHVLRNACDHGLEATPAREKLGKPRTGKITVKAAYEGKQVVIEIGDDGQGVQVDRVAAKAVNLGLATPEAVARMTRDEKAQLLFLPGLSTAEKITDVSGRGVGMDVVKQTVDSLGGHIGITTEPGVGTTFRIVLPPASFTLSVTASVLVQVADSCYGLPMEAVRETVKVTLDQVQILGSHPAICLRGDLVPIRPLADLLDPQVTGGATGREGLRRLVRDGQVAIAILTTPLGLLGLAVDQLIGQQGLVVKPLPRMLGNLPGISGASIQADGGILLMIDAASLTGGVRENVPTTEN